MTAEEQQPVNREGAWAQQAEAALPTRRHAEEIERAAPDARRAQRSDAAATVFV